MAAEDGIRSGESRPATASRRPRRTVAVPAGLAAAVAADAAARGGPSVIDDDCDRMASAGRPRALPPGAARQRGPALRHDGCPVVADAPSAPASSASPAPDGLPAMKCHTLRGQPWSPPPTIPAPAGLGPAPPAGTGGPDPPAAAGCPCSDSRTRSTRADAPRSSPWSPPPDARLRLPENSAERPEPDPPPLRSCENGYHADIGAGRDSLDKSRSAAASTVLGDGL